MTETETKAFEPNAVFIPEEANWKDSEGQHADADKCTLLMLDGDNRGGPAYTKEGWERGEAEYARKPYRDTWTTADGEPIFEGRIELLPDLWVVKVDETEYWLSPEVLANVKRIYGVYVFDRRRHVHICSFEATYECHFMGSQYEWVDGIDLDDSELLDRISTAITQGDSETEEVSYFGKDDVDRMIEQPCKEYNVPAGNAGGFKLAGLQTVTYDDQVWEARMSYREHGEF